jgi:hypothetical protein
MNAISSIFDEDTILFLKKIKSINKIFYFSLYELIQHGK